jgi:hypothetical protein
VSKQLTTLAACLQVLFTTVAEQLGRTTGFIQRQRDLTAADFAQTLVFQWLARPNTTLESIARHLDLSPQALQERLGPRAVAFLQQLLGEALKNACRARREPLGLLDRFTAVVVEDTTVTPLPAELADEFPGCGGGTGAGEGAAALKVLIRWDVRNGELLHLSVHAGRTSDKALAARADDLPEGSLHVADQGFFDSERWREFGPKKYWVSRVPTGTLVHWQGAWQLVSAVLAHVPGSRFDEPVGLVQKTNLPCRLVALRCPEEVANRRRQKVREYTREKKGRDPSPEQLRMCAWTVFATNVSVELLIAKELWLVYRCRWQIELLFKRAKQQGGWGFSWGKTGQRIIVELYAKLLGVVVAHWGSLLRGGPLCGVSPVKLFTVVQEFAGFVQASLNEGLAAVERVLEQLSEQLGRVRAQPKRSKKTSSRLTMLAAKDNA